MLLLSDWFYPMNRNKHGVTHANTIKFVSQSFTPLSEANLNANRVWIGARGEHFAQEAVKIRTIRQVEMITSRLAISSSNTT